MKSYTDIEQSKKLARILPIVSADMRYSPLGDMHPWVCTDTFIEKDAIPCWSLAALLDIIPYPTLYKHADETWNCASWVEKVKPYFVEGYDSPINACLEMILKLHEQKLL